MGLPIVTLGLDVKSLETFLIIELADLRHCNVLDLFKAIFFQELQHLMTFHLNNLLILKTGRNEKLHQGKGPSYLPMLLNH